MEDLQTSINENNCNLSLPEGLNNLMFDISREVLRAQPEDMNRFIADYLSAMLVARDSLNVASRICHYISDASGPLQLDDELKGVKLTEHEATKAQQIVNEYLQDDEVCKQNLSARLMEANIEKSKISSVKKALETAFRRKIIEAIPPLDIPFNYNPEAKEAAANTLKLYCKPVITDEEFHSPTAELKVPYGEDNKTVYMKTWKSPSESSDDIFEHIQYDRDIQDFYVSSSNKLHTNSSEASLAGSDGLAKSEDFASGRVPEKVSRVVSYEDDEKHADDYASDESAKAKVYLELSETKNSLDNEVLFSVDNEFDAGTKDEPMQDGSEEYEGEVTEDYVFDSENESDVSVDEDFK